MIIADTPRTRTETAAAVWWLDLADESRPGWRASAERIQGYLHGAFMTIDAEEEVDDAYFLYGLLFARLDLHARRTLAAILTPHREAA